MPVFSWPPCRSGCAWSRRNEADSETRPADAIPSFDRIRKMRPGMSVYGSVYCRTFLYGDRNRHSESLTGLASEPEIYVRDGIVRGRSCLSRKLCFYESAGDRILRCAGFFSTRRLWLACRDRLHGAESCCPERNAAFDEGTPYTDEIVKCVRRENAPAFRRKASPETSSGHRARDRLSARAGRLFFFLSSALRNVRGTIVFRPGSRSIRKSETGNLVLFEKTLPLFPIRVTDPLRAGKS